MSDDLLPGFGQRAVSALLGRKVQNDGAWPHAADHLLGYEDGSALPRDQRGGDDHVGGGHILGHHFLLLLVELLRLRLGVTALILSFFRSEAQLREFGTDALHLLLDGRAGILGPHDSADPLPTPITLHPLSTRHHYLNPPIRDSST